MGIHQHGRCSGALTAFTALSREQVVSMILPRSAEAIPISLPKMTPAINPSPSTTLTPSVTMRSDSSAITVATTRHQISPFSSTSPTPAPTGPCTPRKLISQNTGELTTKDTLQFAKPDIRRPLRWVLSIRNGQCPKDSIGKASSTKPGTFVAWKSMPR